MKKYLMNFINLIKGKLTPKIVVLLIVGLIITIILSIFNGIGYLLLVLLIISFFFFANQSNSERKVFDDFLGIQPQKEDENELEEDMDNELIEENDIIKMKKKKQIKVKVEELQDEIQIIEEHLKENPNDLEAKLLLNKKKKELEKR